jgi:hypothetical protein
MSFSRCCSALVTRSLNLRSTGERSSTSVAMLATSANNERLWKLLDAMRRRVERYGTTRD